MPAGQSRKAKFTHEQKTKAVAAMREHLQTVGDRSWRDVRERDDLAELIGGLPGSAAERRFYRWLGDFKEGPKADTTRPHECADEIADHDQWAREAVKERQRRNLPTTPGQAYYRGLGAQADENLSAANLMPSLLRDAEMMRQIAMQGDYSEASNFEAAERAIRLEAYLITVRKGLLEEINYEVQAKALLHGVMQLFRDEFGAEPQRLKSVLERLNDVVNSLPYATAVGSLL